MHDPLVVAFDIRRPWPDKGHKITRGPRWELTIHRKHAREHEGWNPRRWWRPRYWSPFVTVAGRRFYFPSVVTIWHREPKGRDSGEVCKHSRTTRKGKRVYTGRWRWHVWHWRIQVAPWQHLRRFLFDRCAHCKRRFPYRYAPISHSWDGPKGRWFRSSPGIYHHPCSAVIHLRQTVEQDTVLVRHLLAALRLATDETEPEILARLTDPKARSLEFLHAYRLLGMLGYERDEDFTLVQKTEGATR